jgi:hypothetical protein
MIANTLASQQDQPVFRYVFAHGPDMGYVVKIAVVIVARLRAKQLTLRNLTVQPNGEAECNTFCRCAIRILSHTFNERTRNYVLGRSCVDVVQRMLRQ